MQKYTMENLLRNRIIRRTISILVTCSILFTDILTMMPKVEAASGLTEAPPLSVSFQDSGDANVNYTDDGDIMLSMGNSANVSILLAPEWNIRQGASKGTKVSINLPWIYYDKNGDIATANRKADVPAGGVIIGGIEASFTSAGNTAAWYTTTPTQNSNVIPGTDYDTVNNTGYVRQLLEIASFPATSFNETITFNVTFKFFKLDKTEIEGELPEGKKDGIPENTSANVLLGASYDNFIDSDNIDLGPFNIQPGESGSGDAAADKRWMRFINTNLKWTAEADVVTMPVLWDKYNYAVYELDISNISENEDSIIDHFLLVMRVPNENNHQRGVLDKDMMAWVYDEDEDKLVPNEDTSIEARKNYFGGKYQEGGVLIWDMTGKDTSDFNLHEYASNNTSEFNYIYAASGEIGIQVPKTVAKDEKRVYYVAVPYVNNFGMDYSHEVEVKDTIYFGGRDFAWSKDTEASGEFVLQNVNFKHEKYLENQEKNSPYYLGKDATYYLGKFQNTSNTPVFNTYVVDTLPDHFKFDTIAIEMNGQNSSPEDWFKKDETTETSDFLDVILLKFNDDAGKEKWVSLRDLGLTVTSQYDSDGDKNVWEITGFDQAIEDYILANADYEFKREIKVLFKERIEIDEVFNGQIGIGGSGKYLLDYKNTLNTYFERWNWQQATADREEGYIKETKMVADPAIAILNGQHANPLMGGYGIYYVTDDDGNTTAHINSETDSTGQKYQPVSIGDPNAAVRFEVGNGNDSIILPGKFYVDNLMQRASSTTGAWEGLLVDEITISDTLLNVAEIESITFTFTNGGTQTINWSDVIQSSAYDNGVISAGLWGGATLAGVELRFGEFEGSVPLNNGEDAYIEFKGSPNAIKKLYISGSFSTLYNEYPAVSALGNVNEDVVTSTAMLDVRDVIPTIEATANWDGTSAASVTVPHKVSALHPDKPAFYEFKVGNNSIVNAKDVHLTLDILSVMDIDSSANEIIKGFDTEKIVIKKGYDKAMTIEYIELFDYDDDVNANPSAPSVVINKDEFESYTNSDGDLVIDISSFSDKIYRLKAMRIVDSSFSQEIKDKDRAVIQVYGNTDGYNNYYTNKRLDASMTFKPVGIYYGNVTALTKSAAFSVEAPALTLHADIYQLDVKSASLSSTTNTDKNEKILGVPYARNFTYRVEVRNDNISIVDDALITIDLPQISDGGFHPTSVRIYKDLMELNHTIDEVKFVTDSSVLTENLRAVYDDAAQVLVYNDIQYELDETGTYYEIPIEDILADGENLKQMVFSGKDFDITTGKTDIEPYIEINGWSDSKIDSRNVLSATATNYLDALRDLNPVYSVVTKDTAVAYISKLYYDTTIVAGYNTGNASKRYERVTTPVEDVRLQYKPGRWDDNAELEIGYKGLGSYAVDFSQHLDKTAALPTNDGGKYTQDIDSLSYIKKTSFNTAATVKMTVELPENFFEAYYLKIDARTKDYLHEVQIVRANGDTQVIPLDKVEWSNNFGRVNLLNIIEEEDLLSDDEKYYYKDPDTNYTVDNPVTRAIITLKINQEESTYDESTKTEKANVPDYGTWWENTNESSMYMFEFAGRFYRVGVAGANVSTELTIGNVDQDENKHDSIVRTTTGTSANKSGGNWSFKNYYTAYDVYGYHWRDNVEYKANDLYSATNVIVVRDFSRTTKGATNNANQDSNYNAKISDNNQYYIDFKRASRTDRYNYDLYHERYEAGVSTSNWGRQDYDDWRGKFGYADKVSIIDTLGKIRPDATYQYNGTLTTGLSIHKDIYKYLREDAAIVLTLGTGATNADQNANKQTFTVKKSDLIVDSTGNYYELKFDNSADSMDDASSVTTDLTDGVLVLAKNQYPLSFEVILWDVEGDGEYLSETGLKHSRANLTNERDIIVKVKPYSVYQVDSETDARNYVTTKTYEDIDSFVAAHNSYMFNDYYKNGWTNDYAVIMGYRRPFKAGQKLIAMGRTEIDKTESVTSDGKTTITDYHTEDAINTYTKIDHTGNTDGVSYSREENKTPTNAQFGVQIFNEKVNTTNDKEMPVRIRQAVSTSTMNTYYRMRNLYIPIQWINDGENGQWFHISNMDMTINGTKYILTPTANAIQFKTAAGAVMGNIPLTTIKKVNGVDCYVLNIEDFARDNAATYPQLVGTTATGMARIQVNNFNITFIATHWDLDDDSTMLSNGEYLSVDKAAGYAYFYDGVYVERSREELDNDVWTVDSQPTFGKTGNNFSPSVSNSNRTVTNNITTKFTSADVNANIFAWASGYNLSASYNLRNAVAIIQPSITKIRKDTDGTSLFAYDLSEKNGQTEVDINHIVPYDYVEYILSSYSHSNSEVPLTRNHLEFVVPKGQQIVGWQLVSCNIKNAGSTDEIEAEDIKASLSDGTNTISNVLSGKNYSAIEQADGSVVDTHYRKITFVVGDEDTLVYPGEGVKIRIITQTTDELSPFEAQSFTTNAYVYAEHQHGYSQYAIDGYASSGYVAGYTGTYDTRNDVNTNDKVTYSRHYSYVNSSTYVGQMQNTLTFYNNTDVGIKFAFDNLARQYNEQGATITISNIKNDTMHHLREQTVTVNFVDGNGDQGFHITKIPTTSISKADGGDIYYPDDFVALKTDSEGNTSLRDILVECLVDTDADGVGEWKTAEEIEVLVDDKTITLEDITAVRWTYYDLIPGYDVTGSAYKTMMTFDNVVLEGTAAYEDIRKSTNAAANVVMADQYKGVFTATITHVHEHNEEITVVNSDGSESEIVRNKDISLQDSITDDELIYREVPQVILHPQVFDDKNSATSAYNANAGQKKGYRPNQKYWQKITLINREMVTDGKQTARQGRLFAPVIYDKLPTNYVSVVEDTLDVKWYDKTGALKEGNYRIIEGTAAEGEYKDYAGAMIYEKTGLQTGGTGKAFRDFTIDAKHTYDTAYQMKTYTVVDENGEPITMGLGETLTVYYQLQIAEDGLPMVYVDQDANLSTTEDRHPGYFPRMGEYFQVSENHTYYGDGKGYPFTSDDPGDEVHYRRVKNENLLMDMDYLLHDIGVTATLNEHVDRWEFLKDSIVYIPGNSQTQNNSSYIEYNYDGDNWILGDYDISSSNYMQKTVYTPSTNTPNGADEDMLPDSHTLLHPTSGLSRDWYEMVVEKRIYDAGNWGSETPIIWGENRIHLQKAWLVGASEFVSTNSEQRKYETTSGDGLSDGRPSNPNYRYYDSRSTYNGENYLHSLTNDNFETALEYNQNFGIKLQALNYGDWDLSQGVEFIYTMPAGMEPLIFNEDGEIDSSKVKVDILTSATVTANETQTETFNRLNAADFDVSILQRPDSDNVSYLAPTQAQDPIWQSGGLKADYPSGADTTPWVLRIVVKKNLNQWFGRGSESGYKFYVSFNSHVVRTNDSEEWFDRLQVRPYVNEDSTNQDYYYYQIMDIDHWEGTTRTNMQHNQRYGMDYLWYRGSYSGINFSHGTYHYYNGSMNTPYINGYNIQNREVTISKNEEGIQTAAAVNNKYNYGNANDRERYAQTGTRAVMRKPMLRQWTTVGNDIDGTTLHNYYINTEVDKVLFNLHVENKYYWDAQGTNGEECANGSGSSVWKDTSKEEHSYATDGGFRGSYILPVITNILPYGIAPIGEDAEGNKDIYSMYNDKNKDLKLSWDLKGLNGESLNDSGAEKQLYDTEVRFEQIPRTDADGNHITDDDGNTVTEGRYVIRFYAKADATAGNPALEAKIASGAGRTFSFETYTYEAPKLDTLQGVDNPNLADFYENNYTYISSKIDNFKAKIDEDIAGNPYTVGAPAYTRYQHYHSTSFCTNDIDNRSDAILKQVTSQYDVTRTYGKLPNSGVNDKVTGATHQVIGQGMERVYENVRVSGANKPVYNIEDYTHNSANTQIRDYLVLEHDLTDFNQNDDEIHYDYAGGTQRGDMAFVNTTKVRTRKANLILNNYVGKNETETGVQTPTLTNGKENTPGSVKYTGKTFDYGDEVWYTAKVTNKTDNATDYAKQGSIHHSRFVFSYYLPDIVTYVGEENWDKWKPKDFVIELNRGGTVTQITPENLAESGWGIRVINKAYLTPNDETDHSGQVVTFEVIPAASEGFENYKSYADGLKPAGHLAYGDTLTLKIRTRVDNKEREGIDPSDDKSPNVWEGYYSEVYATLHTTNGDYIVTDKGNIYNDTERDQISSEENIAFDGYSINASAKEKYGFPMQTQTITTIDFRDKVVSDELTDDGELVADYDRDGQYDLVYAYASSGQVSVWKPEASVRIDTGDLRRTISDPNTIIPSIDDAHVRSSDIMDIRLTQSVNELANVNEFVVNMDIPHRGTNKGTPNIADMNAKAMLTLVKEIRTGNWELPDDCANREIYEKHLKVYVYGLIVEKPWNISGYESPYSVNTGDAKWVPLGDESGYALNDSIDPDKGNALISDDEINAAIKEYSNQYNTDNNLTGIYQLKWVIRTEGFSEDGKTYTQEEAAINYPVPKGLRLAIASEGVPKKEINSSDSLEYNIDESIMHHEGVVNNCAYVSINTSMLDISDGIVKHVNFFASTYAKYDDHKVIGISKTNRAGYYIDPELPTLEIDYQQGYFKPITYVEEGTPKIKFAWDYNNSAIDVETSNVLKYRVTMKNRKKSEEEKIKIEDKCTNPLVTVALPYNENIDVTQLQYIDNNISVEDNNYLKDEYESHENLNDATPLWTWYVVDTEGNIVENEGLKALKVSDDSPAQTVKKLSVKRTENSKIFNFYFTGELNPGENLIVEVMVPIIRMNSNTTSDELLRSKAYISKSGQFTALTPDTGAVNAAAYEFDSQDVNENGNDKDGCLTKETTALTFTTIDALGQTKLVDTDLETNVSQKPAAVTEAGVYTFKASTVNSTNTAGYEFKENVIFDVLPYEGDSEVYNLDYQNGEEVKTPRFSKWNGWLDINSLVVKETVSGVSGNIVASNKYTIWVGPIIKDKSGAYKLNYDSNNLPIVPDPVTVMNDSTALKKLVDSDTEKAKYFVKLNDLKAYLKNVSLAEQDKLVKGIRSIWLQMNKDYTIGGYGRLELSYDMRVPQNVPKYVGTVQVDGDSPIAPSTQIQEAVKDNLGINTFMSRAYSALNKRYYEIEPTNAMVYVDAPSKKGYLGSYVWTDVDFNAKIDEGTYADTYGIGRDLLETPLYDLDGDGDADDPGINGVLVELLSENGRPVNKDGEAVADAYPITNLEDDKGKFIVINDETGEPLKNDEGTIIERFKYAQSGPVSFVTESDYYGNQGYFVMTDIEPGKYNLRYTFPDSYLNYSVSTRELNSAKINKTGVDINTPVIVYRDGKVVYNGNDPLNDTTLSDAQKLAYAVPQKTLVVQTAECVEVKAVEEDQTSVDGNGMTPHERYDRQAMGYNLGVGATYFYKGTTWLDETEVQTANGTEWLIDGIMANDEKRLGQIRVEAYEVDSKTGELVSNKPAITAEGYPAVFTTSDVAQDGLKAGEFVFKLVPGKTYVIRTTDENNERVLKPTAPIFSSNPMMDTTYNDLLLDNKVRTTRPFEAPLIEGSLVAGWETYHETHTIDLGLVDSSRGFIGEYVWDDKDYDGIQDIDELGIPNVIVTLESYYYKDGKWESAGADKKTTTNAAGVFKFTLSTFYSDGVDQYLTGYKVRIDRADNESLFQKYNATWQDKASNGTQSDMHEIPDSNGRYYLNDDQVLIAKPADFDTSDENALVFGDDTYDIANADTVNLDAGFKLYETGALDGVVWLETDYDGIRESDEILADPMQLTSAEQHLSNVKVVLDSYYYDGSVWTPVKKNAHTVGLTMGADQFYHYNYSALDATYSTGGRTYLMGYRIRLENVDDSLRQTLSYKGKDKTIDSNLVVTKGQFELNKEDEYIIVAFKLSAGADAHESTVEWDGDIYDLDKHRDISSYDAGLKSAELSTIRGTIWIDSNYDGIMNDILPADNTLLNKEVILKRYIVSEDNGSFVYTEDPSGTQTTKTDATGAYAFTNIQNYYVDALYETHLYAYKVEVKQQQFAGSIYCGRTKVHMGDDPTLDSDWLSDETLYPNEGEYLILMGESKSTTPDINSVLGYDVVIASPYSALNAGVGVIQHGKISGTIFDDTDYDGIFEDDEVGTKNVTVYLRQYMKVAGQDEYETTGKVVSTVTDANGNYTFSDVNVFGYNREGDTVMYAYRLDVEKNTLPPGYKITKYHVQDEGRVSHLDKKSLELICDEDVRFTGSQKPYIVLATESDDNKAMFYSEGYDMAEGIHVKELDGGITNYRPDTADNGKITGTIFNDEDYDGVFEENENGKKGITVLLTQYMKVPGEDAYEPTGAMLSTVTDANGNYEFAHLRVFDLNMSNELTMYAYRVSVARGTLPPGYKITKYHVQDEGRVSHLDKKSLELICDEEARFTGSNQPFIILAEKTDDTEVLYYNEGYDMAKSVHVKELDGGITNYRPDTADKGKITGTIFNDRDDDGIFDAKEQGKKDIVVILSQYMKVPGEDAYEPTGGAFTTVTDANGNYEFADLPVFDLNMNNELTLYAYRVTVLKESIPQDFRIAKYLVDEDERESRLDVNTLEIISREDVRFTGSTEPYIILAEKTNDTEVMYYGEGYDMATSIHVKEMDGGITNYRPKSAEEGKISGTIFNDRDEDGRFDAAEQGIKEVSVILTQYMKVPGEDVYEQTGALYNAVTDENGNYVFEGLPVFGHNMDNELALYAYRVAVLDETIPADYRITKYLDEEGRVSRLDSDTLELICRDDARFAGGTEPYIILAEKTDDTGVVYYHEGYDMEKSVHVKELDGGITNYRPVGADKGSISGSIFTDRNPDGIWATNEKGRKDITILLTQYMKKPGEDIYEATGSVFTTVTDENGYYEFTDLPTFGINKESEPALYAYRVTVLDESLPEGYKATNSPAVDEGRVSRLDAESLDLIGKEDVRFAGSSKPYIILAEKTTDTDVVYYNEGYDMAKSIDVKELDGGITNYRPGSAEQGLISGTIFTDKNQDGIWGENEKGRKDITILLTQYRKALGEDIYEATGDVFTTVTDENGYYEFANLPTFGLNTKYEPALFAYRVTVLDESIPEGYRVTEYLAADNERVSRLDAETLELICKEDVRFAGSTEPYIILAEKTENTEVLYYNEGYDMEKSIQVVELNGGITNYRPSSAEAGKISGTIFNDEDYDGFFDNEENGEKDITIILTQYWKTPGEDVYEATGEKFTTVTDKNGDYEFTNLPSFGLYNTTEPALYAYRVTVQKNSIPKGYEITRYLKNDTRRVSQLDSKTLELICSKNVRFAGSTEPYIILAEKTEDKEVVYYNEGYDMEKSVQVVELDGGMFAKPVALAKTGDDSMLWLYVLLCLGSFITVSMLLLRERKRQ